MMHNGRLILSFLVMCLWLSLSIPALADPGLSRQAAIDRARQAVAIQASLAPQSLQVESAQAVDWPDSSLGCPQPGMMYQQMITPGYRVSLLDTTSGKIYRVHLAGQRAIICDPPPGAGAQDEKSLRFGQRWQHAQEARALLARRLGVAIEAISVLGSKEVAREKAPPGCRPMTGDTLQLIELRYRDTTYRYARVDERSVPCDQDSR